MKRKPPRKFESVEEKLIKYLKTRDMNYKHYKYGTSFEFIQENFKRWEKYLELIYFKVSPGWISYALKSHNIEIINIHGEANDMIAKEYERVMSPQRK